MNYAEVETNVAELADAKVSDEFIFELLLAYGLPKATISRLKNGGLNLAKDEKSVLLKKKVCFRSVEGDLLGEIEVLRGEKAVKTNEPRFLIVSDGKNLLAIDQKTAETLDCAISALKSHFDFFLPLAGMEKTRLSNENPADIKAAERMAKLFDVIRADNADFVRENPHDMNVFLARLLFCLFAEDTGIFPENVMCNAIASHTAADGSDLGAFFKRFFDILDRKERKNLPKHLEILPYVNGGLFKDHFELPKFSARARRMIIECGTLNWSQINPDIFGSMFQAVIDAEKRHDMGQHYTSVTNIMKVIEPLFLNDFYDEFERAKRRKKGKKQALERLLGRIWQVKIFDPACGSGNFLIIAYKELRKLEMSVFQALQSIESTLPLSQMTVSQFFGIEIDDFAHETAILALWLTEHQMNLESKKVFGQAPVSLPLKEGANIVCGNACRIDWETVCPKNEGDEIYVLGNPPYYGSSLQSDQQKKDMEYVFEGHKNFRNLDYIGCWFFKGSQYIGKTNIKLAFVSTNSICQGEQVAMLWPIIFRDELEIGFCHQSFLWSNNAKNRAAVSCVIIGLQASGLERKLIFKDGLVTQAANINPYLVESKTELIVLKRRKPISNLPPMTYGNKPADGGNLILNTNEKDALIKQYPEADRFVKKLMGAHEFTEGAYRWCLWIKDDELQKAMQIPLIAERIAAVRRMRLLSKKKATRKLASVAHQFGEIRHRALNSILVPRHGSERRDYMPLGFLCNDTIVSDSVQVVYTNEIYVFGLLTSIMHNIWIKAVCGKIKEDPRYSSALGYNTFPVPDLTATQKQTITMHVGEVLAEREKHCEKTMAQLYDPDKMPAGLREAHHQLDLAVDRLYRSKPFASDEERLEHLFKLYEEMVERENENE